MNVLTSLTAAFLVCSLAFGAPASLEARRTCKTLATVDANFDDQDYVLGAVLPNLTPVGTYKGLEYNGFVGIQSLATGLGIVPHSPPNEIVTGLESDLLDGTAFIAASGSTTYFDFHGFYFGCAVDSAIGALGVTTDCTVTATGFYEGKQLAVQEFTFMPSFILGSAQGKASVQEARCHTDFTGVDKVEFTTNDPLLYALLMDDVSYTPHTCSS